MTGIFIGICYENNNDNSIRRYEKIMIIQLDVMKIIMVIQLVIN